VEILANFAAIKAKLVEITLEKHTFPKFPRFLDQTRRTFAPKSIGKAGQFRRLKEPEKGLYRQALSLTICSPGMAILQELCFTILPLFCLCEIDNIGRVVFVLFTFMNMQC
jgi:hypothetical protein